VIDQTYDKIEIIVVDDGSTDKTKEIANYFISNKAVSRNRKILYLYQENKGAPIARNYGAKVSKGSYIVFHDSDDFMHPERIKIQIEKITTANAALCCGSWQNYPGPPRGYRCPQESKDCIRDFLVGVILGSNQSWMMTKDIFLRVGGFDNSLKCGQDIDLIFRLMCSREKVVFAPDALTYFCHSESGRISSKGRTREGIESFLRGHEKRVKLLKYIGNPEYLKLEANSLVGFAIDSQYLGFHDIASSALALANNVSKSATWSISPIHSIVFRIGGMGAAVCMKKLKTIIM
jgi:glycosyltransferase involved in cell wall biosynthesis